MESKSTFDPELGVVKTDTFSAVYPLLNEYIVKNREWETCRDGNVKEILDVKTTLTNPYRRLVGGRGRGMNPFFLFAEAMWIFTGRKDVKFLKAFNGRMAEFSDDGAVFHAPYGFRLRHWGVRSEDKFCEDNLHAAQGYDQVSDAIRLFAANPLTRQVVLSIWNPDFDLGTETRDVPCNDIVMMKVRGGKLITTVQNRSNDLHWGLTTNIFQFSFLSEIIAACLGITLGTQTHNSQSLHVYDWNDVTERMLGAGDDVELYGCGAKERRMDFSFAHDVPNNRLHEIDCELTCLLRNLERAMRGELEDFRDAERLRNFSKYLYNVYQYLCVYLNYRQEVERDRSKRASLAEGALREIEDIDECTDSDWDVSIMARNWFARRMDNYEHEFIGRL